MAYYNEVSTLEKQYESLMKQKPEEPGLGCLFAVGICAIFLGAIAPFLSAGDATAILMGILCAAVGIFLVYFRKKKYNEAKEVYVRKSAEWERKCTKVLAEVGKYV